MVESTAVYRFTALTSLVSFALSSNVWMEKDFSSPLIPAKGSKKEREYGPHKSHSRSRWGDSHRLWDDPQREETCEEVGHGIILIKDAQGEVIGFERCISNQKNLPRNWG